MRYVAQQSLSVVADMAEAMPGNLLAFMCDVRVAYSLLCTVEDFRQPRLISCQVEVHPRSAEQRSMVLQSMPPSSLCCALHLHRKSYTVQISFAQLDRLERQLLFIRV